MKTMKKVAMILLALLLVLSSMSIGVSAVGETGKINITIDADKTTNLYPGDIVTFTIYIENNFNYVAMRWPVIYPSKAYEPVVVGETDAAYGNVKAYGSLAGGDSTIESAEFSSDLISGSYGGVSYNKNNYAGLLIQWTGGTTSTGLAYYNNPTGSGYCISFQLRVLDGFAGIGNKRDGIAPVTIPQITNVKNLFYYQAITDPSDLNTLYKMSSADCPVTVTGVTTKIIKEAAQILPKTGTDIILDTQGPVNYIYGFTEVANGEIDAIDEESIKDFITTVGGATYTLEVNGYGVYSTGAVLHAFDANGEAIADYTIVIFGDVDGDGNVTVEDAMIASDAIIGFQEWTWSGDVRDNASYFACDVYGNDFVGPEDFAPIEEKSEKRGFIGQKHSEDPAEVFIYY